MTTNPLPLFLALLVCAACPPRAKPEPGVLLVFSKPANSSEVRTVVDRRLAQLQIKARLDEDTTSLTVRLTGEEGVAQVGRVKELLALPGSLRFCPEDHAVAATWCDFPLDPEVEPESTRPACALSSRRGKEAIQRTLGDAGISIEWGTEGDRTLAYSVRSSDCLQPHITAAEPRDDGSVMVDFAPSSGRDFEALTRATVRHRLLFIMDEQVRLAPVVVEPITTGRAMLTVGARTTEAQLKLLAAALAGGPLPVLTLQSERPFGPPSFKAP